MTDKVRVIGEGVLNLLKTVATATKFAGDMRQGYWFMRFEGKPYKLTIIEINEADYKP